LIRRASLALAEAKRSHRNVLIYSEEFEPALLEPDQESEEHHTRTLATALAQAVDAKDSGTRSHCETVSQLCVMIAEELDLPPRRIAELRLAGLLHDVGKIGIPDAILQKPAKLTDAEFEVMKTHSALGHSIVAAAGREQEAFWILHHHERPDGHGYPTGLRGDELPLESRIILVADAFEAITADRPYRKQASVADALAELERHAGTQFDPRCVTALKQAIAAGSALSPESSTVAALSAA
jgi:HD-GYP domain-containing protein (c-di-GMP phosphodiesterase class II)